MKLYWWVAKIKDDHQCYSKIGKTQAEVDDQIKGRESEFSKPHRRVIEYSDAFDLLEKLTNEGDGRCDSGRPTRKDHEDEY